MPNVFSKFYRGKSVEWVGSVGRVCLLILVVSQESVAGGEGKMRFEQGYMPCLHSALFVTGCLMAERGGGERQG